MGVVNSKYFISAWNEVIQSNGHNFWTVCRMTLKKKTKWREFYWLSFALNFSFVGAKTRILWPFHCCQTKIFFHKKNWHRKKSWHWCNQSTWNSSMMKLIFSVQFIFKVFQDSCLVFAHFGAHKLLSAKTITTIVGCVSFDKVQYSISKGWLLPTTHTIQV